MAQTKAAHKYWKDQPQTNFNWEKDASKMSDEGARALVWYTFDRLPYEIVGKWKSFKRAETDEGRATLTAYLTSFLNLNIFTAWAGCYHSFVDADRNLNRERNKFIVLITYLLYTIGMWEEPSSDWKELGEILITEHSFRRGVEDPFEIGLAKTKRRRLFA